MAVITTGSLVAGCVNGLDSGVLPSGTYSLIKPQIVYVCGNPDGLVTNITGSDIAYDYAGGNFYMGDKTNGVGGSSWNVMSA